MVVISIMGHRRALRLTNTPCSHCPGRPKNARWQSLEEWIDLVVRDLQEGPLRCAGSIVYSAVARTRCGTSRVSTAAPLLHRRPADLGARDTFTPRPQDEAPQGRWRARFRGREDVMATARKCPGQLPQRAILLVSKPREHDPWLWTDSKVDAVHEVPSWFSAFRWPGTCPT